MKRVKELDGLRVAAILAVMAVHYRPPSRTDLDLVSLGWSGVDLFFVISGFLITTILISLRGTEHPYRVFYWRRMLRIFPPYYLVLGILTGYLALKNHGGEINWHLGSWLFLDSFRNISYYIKAVQHLVQTHSLNTQTLPLGDFFPSKYEDGFSIFWSLSVEEMFYLIWAPLVLRCSTRTLVMIGLLAVFFCPVLRMILHQSQWEFFFFPCRFDTLMAGSLLALLFVAYNQGAVRRSTLARSLCAAGLISVCCLFPLAVHEGLFRHVELRSALSFAAFGYSLLALLFGSIVGLCVLYSGSSSLWCKVLRLRPLVYIGSISYMMYLIHIPVWVTTYKLAVRFYGPAFVPTISLGLIATAGTIALASISWRWIEKPLLAYKDSRAHIPTVAIEKEDKLLHPMGRRVLSNPERQS